MNNMTQQFGQMDMSQKQAPTGAQSRPPALNQLYPADLLNTPFNVAELHYPPPPVILPPNVGDLEMSFDLFQPADFDLDECHPFTERELSSQICPIDAECRSHHPCPPQKVSAPICSRHSAIFVLARCRGSGALNP